MATVTNAIENLKLNDTPFWWLYSGSQKVGQYLDGDNISDSIAHLERVVDLLPDGSYKLKSSDKESNHSGAVHFNFSKKGSNAQTATPMQAVASTNAYGVADHVYNQIIAEARKNLMFEQMYDKFGPLVDLVKDMEKRLKKLEKDFYEDEDGDGIPDFMQIAKTASDTMKGVSDVKKAFEGGSGFRF